MLKSGTNHEIFRIISTNYIELIELKLGMLIEYIFIEHPIWLIESVDENKSFIRTSSGLNLSSEGNEISNLDEGKSKRNFVMFEQKEKRKNH